MAKEIERLLCGQRWRRDRAERQAERGADGGERGGVEGLERIELRALFAPQLDVLLAPHEAFELQSLRQAADPDLGVDRRARAPQVLVVGLVPLAADDGDGALLEGVLDARGQDSESAPLPVDAFSHPPLHLTIPTREFYARPRLFNGEDWCVRRTVLD